MQPERIVRRIIRLIVLGISFGFLTLLSGCQMFLMPRYPRLDSPEGAPRTRVLFVGNSLTFYNDLPGLVQQLSAGEPKPVQFEAVTVAYASLEYHWIRGKALALLRKEHWDYVVLQDYSRRPVTDPQNSLKYYMLFDAEVRRAGAKTIIFQNWTRQGKAGEYDAMLASYRDIQDQTKGLLAPIGTAWRICRQEHPEIKLLVDDRHPTEAGTYLAGCVLYGVIYGKDPAELPMNLTGPKMPTGQMEILRGIAQWLLR